MQPERRKDERKFQGRWRPWKKRRRTEGRDEDEEICFNGGGDKVESVCLTKKKEEAHERI